MKKLVSKNHVSGELLHPEFKYVSAAATDIKATFERVRQEMAEGKAKAEKKRNIISIKKEETL